jgi:hypothetical protein
MKTHPISFDTYREAALMMRPMIRKSGEPYRAYGKFDYFDCEQAGEFQYWVRNKPGEGK